jgi:hypothetical protein
VVADLDVGRTVLKEARASVDIREGGNDTIDIEEYLKCAKYWAGTTLTMRVVRFIRRLLGPMFRTYGSLQRFDFVLLVRSITFTFS